MSTKCALIGPRFFSYIDAIRDEFIRRGFTCASFDERHSNSIPAKIAYRLRLTPFIYLQKKRHLNRIAEAIIAAAVTDVFLIGIEVIDAAFVRRLKSRAIRVHLYMWDSARNKRAFIELLHLLDGKSSFEPDDCRALNLVYIPLFAESMFCTLTRPPAPVRRDELVFAGTLRSNRVEMLARLKEAVEGTRFRVIELTYYHSRLLFLLKCLVSVKAVPFLFTVSARAFAKDEIARAYFNARGVLDIHHPSQGGLTSRTFESLRSGARLITFNRSVETLPPRLKERVTLLTNASELRQRLPEIATDLPPLDPDLDYFLSLERFTDDLMALAHLCAPRPAGPPRQS
jgi:hypothetical protein